MHAQCQCINQTCPSCKGRCNKKAEECLIHQNTEMQIYMCSDCADYALKSDTYYTRANYVRMYQVAWVKSPKWTFNADELTISAKVHLQEFTESEIADAFVDELRCEGDIDYVKFNVDNYIQIVLGTDL